MTALVLRSLGRVKILSASLALVLIALQLSIIAGAASFVDSGNFERLSQVAPTFVMQMMGPALTSFRGMVVFAYFDPLIVMLLVQFAIYLATEPAGEVESSLVDLLLARPERPVKKREAVSEMDLSRVRRLVAGALSNPRKRLAPEKAPGGHKRK